VGLKGRSLRAANFCPKIFLLSFLLRVTIMLIHSLHDFGSLLYKMYKFGSTLQMEGGITYFVLPFIEPSGGA